MSACKLCEYMRDSYQSKAAYFRSIGVYFEYGCILQVRNMKDGKLRYTKEKGVPKMAYCPSCGASMKKRIREWRMHKMGLMDIMTKDGISIHVLPDNAKCNHTGVCPLEMDKCPVRNFDDTGNICVPELCADYSED